MRILFFIILLSISSQLLAGERDSLMLTSSQWLSLQRLHDDINSVQPASNKALFANRFLHARAGAQLLNTSYISPIEEGSSILSYGLSFEGYQKLGSSVVWGQATYSDEWRDDVQFNNAADYYFLYPYLIADSIGGERKLETYTLQGGWQQHFNTLTFGIEAQYRAAINNGTSDPRPLNTVSDFNIKAGASKAMLNHQLGAFAKYGSYNQKLEVNSLAEKRNDYIYLLRGFGLQQNRLSGPMASYSNNYFGNTLGAGLTFLPNNNGFIALLTMATDKIELKESKTNNGIVPFVLHNQHLKAEGGYRWQHPTRFIQLRLSMEQLKKTGTERIYSIDNQLLLSENKPFNHTEHSYKANFLLSKIKNDLARFELFTQLRYTSIDAFHLGDGQGSYFTKYTWISPSIQYKWCHYWQTSKLSISHDIAGRITGHTDAKLLNNGTALSKGVVENFARNTQDLIQTKLTVSYTNFTRKRAWSIEPAAIVMANGSQVNTGATLSFIYNF